MLKKQGIIKIICYFVMIILWLYPSFRDDYNIKSIIIHSLFFIGLLSLYLIRNRAIVFFIISITTLLGCIVTYKYLLEVLPVTFCICSHKYASDEFSSNKKNKNYDISNAYLTLSYLIILAEIAYCIVRIRPEDLIYLYWKNNILKIVVCFFIFFIVLIRYAFKEKGNKDKFYSRAVKQIYFSSIAGISVSLLYYFIQYGFFNSGRFRCYMICWYVLILCIYENKDIHLKNIVSDFICRLQDILYNGKMTKVK